MKALGFHCLQLGNVLKRVSGTWRLFRLAGYLVCMFLAGACSKDHSEPVLRENGRTVLVYMAGDNSLSSDGNDNIRLMMKGMEQAGGRLVIYFDPVSDVPHLMTFEQKGKKYVLDTLLTYAEENSASPQVLSKVIKDTKRLCPGNSYGLILWSHGMGWLPESYFFPQIYALRDIKWNPGRPRTKYFGEDNHPGTSYGNSYMEIRQLVEALEQHFEFILFDACFMSAVEVLYELRNKTNYIIASPAEVIAEGFPYDQILPYLWGDETDMKRICQEFYDYYNNHPNGGEWKSAMVALVKTSGLEALAQETRAILQGKSSFPAGDFSAVWRYPLSYYGLPDVFFDFGDYIRLLADETQYAAFEHQLEQVVIYKKTTTGFFGDAVPQDRYSGLTTYIPLDQWENMNTFYNSFSWPKAVY